MTGLKVEPTLSLCPCRYGLFDSDDEGGDVEAMQASTPPQPLKNTSGVSTPAVPAKQGYGLYDEDEDMDDDQGSDQTGQNI